MMMTANRRLDPATLTAAGLGAIRAAAEERDPDMRNQLFAAGEKLIAAAEQQAPGIQERYLTTADRDFLETVLRD